MSQVTPAHLPALVAAREWATQHRHAQPDDRMLTAYGRVLLLAAADFIDVGPAVPLPPSIYSALLREAADASLSPTDILAPLGTDADPTPPAPVDPARVLAALDSLGWPDDREETVYVPRVYWSGVEAAIRAADAASVAAVPARHVVTVSAEGTWAMSHPADCTVNTITGGAVLICLVYDLAVEQMPAGLLSAGRYEVAANDIGDRLRILDRLHDGQCTTTACAACGEVARDA